MKSFVQSYEDTVYFSNTVNICKRFNQYLTSGD